MSRKGKVHTYMYDEYAPPPLSLPFITLILSLEDGTTYRAQGTEMKVADLKIDLPVELVLRRVSAERGISNYGMAFARIPR